MLKPLDAESKKHFEQKNVVNPISVHKWTLFNVLNVKTHSNVSESEA